MTNPYLEGLKELHRYQPSLKSGLFNHAPMVVEALHHLGADASISPWIDSERSNLVALARSDSQDRESQLKGNDPTAFAGDRGRFSEVSAWFAEEIAESGVEVVLDRWTAELAPGFTTAAVHGLLRTAHAARGWQNLTAKQGSNNESQLLLRQELADALASWVTMYAKLPVTLMALQSTAPPHSAIKQVDHLPAAQRAGVGNITAGYSALTHAPDFARQVSQVDLRGEAQEVIDELIEVFADLFCQEVHSTFTAIVFAHAVTGAAAVRNLLPLVTERTARQLIHRAWESGCALKTAFGQPSDITVNHDLDIDAVSGTALLDQIISHGDDHVIKLGEVCLSAYQRTDNPVLLATIRHAMRHIPARQTTE